LREETIEYEILNISEKSVARASEQKMSVLINKTLLF
jgi:hypothetical protein